MQSVRKTVPLTTLALCIAVAIAYANESDHGASSNSFYFYPQGLTATDAGAIPIPSRFRWSVETTWRGADARGKDLPDQGVMLRFYDPARNHTALTAQMSLETAEQLQQSLAEIIAKKRQDPAFQHWPRLDTPDKIPTGRILGIAENGVAIVELTDPSGRTEILNGQSIRPQNTQ
jgi:hypothetical protein